MKIQIGDSCRIKPESLRNCGSYNDGPNAGILVTKISNNGALSYKILDVNGKIIDSCYACFYENDVVSIINNSKPKIMENLKEKFLNLLTPEPAKSFRKAGVTNGDNLLTPEGQELFLNWMFGQNQDLFKKEVVDYQVSGND